MRKKRPHYAPEFRRQMVELVRAGRSPAELENEFEPNKPFVVTFWHTKMDIERYEKETFPKVKQILEPFLYVPPVVRFCKVEETISEKLLETVAA